MNLRPENAVMIDDNPVERAAIEAALPGVRVLGRHLYYLKRVLLWSSETQRSVITRESAQKTEMVRAQLEARDRSASSFRTTNSCRPLRLRVTLSVRAKHERPAPEPSDRTLQQDEPVQHDRRSLHAGTMSAALLGGRELYVLHAEDRFTHYGLVGAAWVNRNCLDHFVLSCRVLGLGIEETFLAHLAEPV